MHESCQRQTRPNGGNPNHHIWNNNGTWWCHFTIHKPDHTKQRVRVSLRTKCRETARKRRDLVMKAVPGITATLLPIHPIMPRLNLRDGRRTASPRNSESPAPRW
ncbi:MAG: hypothetical protein IAE97_11555 [Chthoniobacterales bacterium]|nr:hypothetical protein [Chthoniobacterales bacterium]